jgi:hypothetical protein
MARPTNRYRKGEKSTDIRVGYLGGKPSLIANWGGRMYGVPLSTDGAGNTTRDSNFGNIRVKGDAVFDSGASVLRIKGDGISIKESNVEVASFGSTVIIGEVGVSKSNVEITSGAINLRTNTTDKLTLDADGNITITGKISYNAGSDNIIIAGDAGVSASLTGGDNCFIGEEAGLVNTSGASNIAIGSASMKANILGKQNICIGHNAGNSILGTSDANDGSHNICIGFSAGDTITTGNDCTIVGYNAEPSAVGTDNEVVIGASLTGKGANTAYLGGTSGAYFDGSLFVEEQAAAVADVAGFGQLWVKNTTPCELWFTDDAGTDTKIV